MKTLSTRFKLALMAAAIAGAALGSAPAITAQSFPNQCYNNGGPNLCPFCGGGCLGSDYLCCNQQANET